MPVGKKLMVVVSVMATGMGTAFFFRKDASHSTDRQAGLGDFPFRERVERRVAADAARENGTSSMLAGTTMRATETWFVPNAAPAAISEPASMAAEADPIFQRSVSPVGALLSPLEAATIDESPAAESPSAALDMPGDDELTGPITHRIADGDTLATLAAQYLGTKDRYLDIFEFNRDILSRPDVLPIGVLLKIPRKPGELKSRPGDGGWTPGVSELDPLLPIVPIAPRHPVQIPED